MVKEITICFHGKKEGLTVEYQENQGPDISGFDVLEVPFAKEKCIG